MNDETRAPVINWPKKRWKWTGSAVRIRHCPRNC